MSLSPLLTRMLGVETAVLRESSWKEIWPGCPAPGSSYRSLSPMKELSLHTRQSVRSSMSIWAESCRLRLCCMSEGETKGTRKSLIFFLGGGDVEWRTFFRALFPIDNAMSQNVHCAPTLHGNKTTFCRMMSRSFMSNTLHFISTSESSLAKECRV